MDSILRDRVAAVYRAADAAVAAAGPRCEASGRCCRFTEYGHTLFLSDLEAEYLLESAPPVVGPVTPDGCPFQVDGLCTARESRPLGCRVYFCDPTFQDRMPDIIEAGIRELKRVADEVGRPWRYAPLHEFLGAAATAPIRKSLPLVAG
jgi:Fe-S-cluster containining protein